MTEIVHYGCFDRGMVVVLPQGMKSVYFGTAPIPAEGNEVFYVASFDRSKEEDVKREEALKTTKPFMQGKIRYIPSVAELEARAKQKAQDEACETMRKDLGSGLYILNLDGLNQEQLIALADKIGAKAYGADGRAMSAMIIRKSISGRLGLVQEAPPEPVEVPENDGPQIPKKKKGK